MNHLNGVRGKGLFTSDLFDICEELNRGRNYFLHWKPGRFEVPKYRGLDVTTDEGCLASLRAVDGAIQALAGGEN